MATKLVPRDRVTFTRAVIAKRGDIVNGSIGVVMRVKGDDLIVLVDTAYGKHGIVCTVTDCNRI